MHQILHGIRLAFLRPVGACLGLNLLLLLEENLAENRGDLLPVSGVEDNGDLPPMQRGDEKNVAAETNDLRNDDEGDLLPLSGDDDGNLLPQLNGEKYTENRALPALCHGHQEDEENEPADKEHMLPTIDGLNKEEEGILSPKQRGEEWGRFQPLYATSGDGGTFKPANANEDDDGVLRPTIGDLLKGDFSLYYYYIPLDVMHDGTQILFAYMHAEIGGLGMASTVHDYLVIAFAKPRVDPKVKKKTSLLLCLTIHTPFDPGEYGHDGSPPYTHHEPYSSHFLDIEISHTPPHPHPNAYSSSAFSLFESLSNEEKDAHEELEAATTSMFLPFTPLRGSKMWQAHEMQMKLDGDAGTKTKLRMTTMRLFYINKDLLDPG